MILDTKEKYGSLRVDISYGNNAMVEMGDILNMLSRWTCCACGKMPRNSNGNRIIWETKGWICPYCKDCIKKDMKGDWTLKYTNWKIRQSSNTIIPGIKEKLHYRSLKIIKPPNRRSTIHFIFQTSDKQ